MWQACHAAGKAFNIAAVGGGKVNPTGGTALPAIATNCDQVHVRYGVNDLPDLPAGNAAFQTAYSTMVDNIRTRIGAGKPIYCYQPQPVSAGSQRANAGSLIQAAISGKSDVYYVGTDNLVPIRPQRICRTERTRTPFAIRCTPTEKFRFSLLLR